MRWTIALNVVATLASLISVEAQETTTFHDKETGFTFSQFAAQYAIGKYIYFRIAVPSPIPVNSSYDAVLQVVAPIDVTGWTGLAWGGQMVADPLTVAWQNGNNVVFSSRYATAHVMPTTYTGATYTAFKTGTHTRTIEPPLKQGGCPVYVVNVSAVSHIQAAVNFAREKEELDRYRFGRIPSSFHQVVTADGKFVTTSSTENTDLFWAVHGGVGVTFGVVTSMVVKAFPDVETTVVTLELSVKGNNISVETFWKGVSSYFSYFDKFKSQDIAAQWGIYPNGAFLAQASPSGKPKFEINPFVASAVTMSQIRPSATASHVKVEMARVIGYKRWENRRYWQEFLVERRKLLSTMDNAANLSVSENIQIEEKFTTLIQSLVPLIRTSHNPTSNVKMIDHVLGRPSVQFRKIQVLAVVSFWSFYLFRGHKHGPPTIRKLSRKLSGFITPWQTLVITLLYLYIARNLGKLLGLECPEPLANLYTRSYFRATWVTTALDAGFWTAMRIKRKWVRDLASVVFTAYYLIAAEQADEKVRKIRGALTVEHLRVSWNKGRTPYLKALQTLMRPRFMRYPPRAIRIPRPSSSDYKEPVNGWLYFDGPLSALKNHTKIVLDIPGGGFVAMDPRTSDDKLFAWAGKTSLPILSLDYRKAPEFPYPYALNECFDVYCTIVVSKGRCIGLSGDVLPKIVLSGDSAGGNLATSTTLMIIEAGSNASRQFQGQKSLPIPDGLVLMYPGLDMNIGNWMSEEQMSLIKDRRMRKTNRNIIRRKSMQYTLAAGTPHQSEDEDDNTTPKGKSPEIESAPTRPTSISLPSPQYSTAAPAALSPSVVKHSDRQEPGSHHPQPLKTRLAMSSMISYFNDRILSPEMMRAMIILYIGPHNRPDFSSEYLLSPILAPDSLLAQFPKTYFLTGERDPLVDDTVIFAGRLRRAKAAKHAADHASGSRLYKEFDERDVVEVFLIPGISHGFLQFVGCFPEGWKYIFRCARWIEHIFAVADEAELHAGQLSPIEQRMKHHHRSKIESSGDEDMGLEMSMTPKSKEKSKQAEDRRKKEKLLKEQLREKGEGRHKIKGLGEKKKSMVSLASSDDLLGRRMLGLAGPLTGTGGDVDD
ncbi:hypothetical protein G7Y89_g9113 [Cudoniella acicularis]|uniref:Hormone-sensitive lipase n=1 Tax=Cudoniella acicularis TaxID=354080 RepID=A0A8H4VZY4_9HELO|nr:hypothetical protein G7Y89_g9113 [Cudoniella acicularis]